MILINQASCSLHISEFTSELLNEVHVDLWFGWLVALGPFYLSEVLIYQWIRTTGH